MTSVRENVDETEGDLSLEKLAEFREILYRMLAVAFFRPASDFRLAINAASDLSAGLNSYSELGFVPLAREFLTQLESLGSSTDQEINLRYDRLFAKTMDTGGVPLEESAFMETGNDNTGWVLVAIERMYTSAGFAVEAPPGVTSDHIGVQLEFLAALCNQEADALAEQDHKEARRIQARQLRFVKGHPVKWIPYLEGLLETTGDELYVSAARLTHSLLLHDYDLIEQTREMLRVRA